MKYTHTQMVLWGLKFQPFCTLNSNGEYGRGGGNFRQHKQLCFLLKCWTPANITTHNLNVLRKGIDSSSTIFLGQANVSIHH